MRPSKNSTPRNPATDIPTPPVSPPLMKRVFLRLRSGSTTLNDLEISNRFLAHADLPPLRDFQTPHYMHGGDGGYEKVYHIILDINHADAPANVKIQDIPHEMYRVHFRQGATAEPTFERLYGQWLSLAMSFSNGYWWGTQGNGTAP